MDKEKGAATAEQPGSGPGELFQRAAELCAAKDLGRRDGRGAAAHGEIGWIGDDGVILFCRQEIQLPEIALHNGDTALHAVLPDDLLRRGDGARLKLYPIDVAIGVGCTKEHAEGAAAGAEVKNGSAAAEGSKGREQDGVCPKRKLVGKIWKSEEGLFHGKSPLSRVKTTGLCTAQARCYVRDYSSTIALLGHSPSQVPQLTHSSSLIT